MHVLAALRPVAKLVHRELASNPAARSGHAAFDLARDAR